jgi:hypothetical protein
MLPHCVECDAMLQTPPRKATKDHWEVLHVSIIFFEL